MDYALITPEVTKAMLDIPLLDRFRGCLLGLACGDAIGTTVEFRPRGSFLPVTDMVGGGVFRLRPGQWTDDTSMALCLASSLVETGGFNAHDQMDRYCRWMDNGYWSSNGRCFDIGTTTRMALLRYKQTGSPWVGSTDPNAAGNGCLMRLAPIPMYFYGSREQVIQWSAESSRTTHGARECIDSSRLFAAMIHDSLSGNSKDAVLLDHGLGETLSPRIQAIANGEYRSKSEIDIRSTGYVVDSLEAALWVFHQTDTYADAVLMAVNLGGDADTIAAICGQLAGAYYGAESIPLSWRETVALSAEIIALADRCYEQAHQRDFPRSAKNHC